MTEARITNNYICPVLYYKTVGFEIGFEAVVWS